MKPIEAATCVDAWLQACDHLLEHDKDNWRAYNVILEITDPIALPSGEEAVVRILDRFLTERGGLPFSTVVNTIFPAQLYVRHGAAGVYDRYVSEVYPQIEKHPDCSWGTYAHRILCRTAADGATINPLRDLIKKLKTQLALDGPNRAVYELGVIDPLLDIPIYDPTTDRSLPIGGPCLTHVSVKLTAKRSVMVTGFYRSHFYVQRALGNLFGLAHLQHFIAQETGLAMGPLVCHSSMAHLDLKNKKKGAPEHEKWGKPDIRELIARCHAARQPVAA
ncbi:MAG: hypothetical protein ACREYF_09475 [Gammaproteobacteria bacterium]